MASDALWNPELWVAAGGAIPDGWSLVPFEEFLETPKSLSVGVMYPGEHLTGGVPLIRVSDVADGGAICTPNLNISAAVHYEYRRTELRGDELLITLVGKPGVCVIVRPDMKGWNIARALAAAKLKRPELRAYLKAVMECGVMKSIITSMLNTTVQPTLNLKEIKSLPIPFPNDIEEAFDIGASASLFDDRIDNLRQTNATLEAIAAALFKSWFADFDGVAQEDMQESELGLIPKGWQVVNFGELLESSIGGDWGKEQPEDDHDQRVCIIRGTDFPDLKIGGKGGVPCRYTTKKKMASRLLQEGDIIIEVSGGSPTQPTGRSVRITNSILARFDNPVVCASFCRRFRPKNLALGTLAACHLNALYQAGGTWEYQNQSTGISNFQTTHFLEAEKVALPPEDVVDRFYQMVNPFLEQMTTNQSMTVAIS